MDSYTQSVIENSRTWHDLNSLSQLRSQGDNRAAITEAAKQFESVFFSMMMKSMRDAANAVIEKPFFDSPSLDLFQDMYDKQLSLSVGGEGTNFGIAEILVEQLTRGRQFAETSNSDNIEDNESDGFRRQSRAPDIVQPVTDSVIQPIGLEQRSGIDNKDPISPSIELGAVTGPDRLAEELPTTFKGMDFSSPSAFVASLLPIAKEFASRLQLDPKVMVAQAALETGWGKFVMRTIDGVSSHNLFGIKADRNWNGPSTMVNTLEFKSGELQQTKAAFRSYNNHEESFQDYVDFLNSNGRYDKALGNTKNVKGFLDELQAAGYATDPDYADKIYQIYRSETFNNAVNTATE